jgi:hypothetical protein
MRVVDMTKAWRLAGYALMVVTVVIALGAKQGWMSDFGRVPAAAVAIMTGAFGIVLVFTDMMVRALYTQTAKMAQAQLDVEHMHAERPEAEQNVGQRADM